MTVVEIEDFNPPTCTGLRGNFAQGPSKRLIEVPASVHHSRAGLGRVPVRAGTTTSPSSTPGGHRQTITLSGRVLDSDAAASPTR